eukprot:5206013-Amphidinium_carterae.1
MCSHAANADPVSFKTASSVSFFACNKTLSLSQQRHKTNGEALGSASSCVFAVRMLAMDAMTSASTSTRVKSPTQTLTASTLWLVVGGTQSNVALHGVQLRMYQHSS